jgi:hypothetical protein
MSDSRLISFLIQGLARGCSLVWNLQSLCTGATTIIARIQSGFTPQLNFQVEE